MVAPTRLGVTLGTPVVAMRADGAAAVEKLRAEADTPDRRATSPISIA